ncbi:uncharacterized protein LOC103524116 [Trichonephila clavipes]|nr:uncharacterized protein LOC103524116 [Trichonephila clavipes]
MGKIKGKIVFQWVPSHCGLWGNERADFLAKKGTASRVARDKPWSTLCKKSHGIPSSPRAAAVAKFRLLTGHGCLCAYLFRFNLVTSPICVLCDTGQDMTAAHLDECSALNDLNCFVKRSSSLCNRRSVLKREAMHVKTDDVQSPPVGVVWRFGDGLASTSAVLETSPQFKMPRCISNSRPIAL